MPSPELTVQKNILTSVIKGGGFGRKWASDFQVGMPDLILAMPRLGTWLCEVKHEHEPAPSMTGLSRIANHPTKIQRSILTDFYDAGARVLILNSVAFAVGGSKTQIKVLVASSVDDDEQKLYATNNGHNSEWLQIEWKPGVGYNMVALLTLAQERYYGGL